MTEMNRILSVLESGPATAREISDETGIKRERVSIHLSQLKKMGALAYAGKVPREVIVVRQHQVYRIATP